MHTYITTKEIWILSKIFTCNGLNRVASLNLALRIRTWEKNHGIKWVVKRLKTMFHDLYEPLQTNSIKKHKDGSWKGDFRPVYSLSKRRGEWGLDRAARILKIYGRWELKSIGIKETDEFIKTIQPQVLPAAEDLQLQSKLVIGEIQRSRELRYLAKNAYDNCKFRSTYPSGPKKSPVSSLENLPRYMIAPHEHVDIAIELAPNIYFKHYTFLSRIVIMPRLQPEELVNKSPDSDVVGTIVGLTKDRGLKARFIANPLMLFQNGMSRLKDACRILLESLPESCVFDQDTGPSWAERKFEEGFSLTSLDLSSCSDLLPADPQFDILEALFPQLRSDISLFRDVSRAPWSIKYGKGRRNVRWFVGQPLGTDPSFFSFTLFIILMIRANGGLPDDFRVIGDDLIMISDLSDRILNVYNSLKVPINLGKSFIKNSNVAEFAGRIITRRGGLRRVFKATPFDWRNDPLGYIRQYGYRAIRFLYPATKNKNRLTILALLPKPIGFGKENQIFKRLPHSLSNEILLPRLKALKVPKRGIPHPISALAKNLYPANAKPDLGCFIARNFLTSMVRTAIKRISEYRAQGELDAYEEYSRNTYKGVGIWTSRAFTYFDPQLEECVEILNSFVKEEPLVPKNAPIIVEAYETVKNRTTALETIVVEDHIPDRHPPLTVLHIVWRKIRKYFRKRK